MKKKVRKKVKLLTKYIKMKLKEKDYHGVSDAANDIRELIARGK